MRNPRGLAALAVIAVALGLAACSSPADSEPAESPSVVQSEPAEPPGEPSPGPDANTIADVMLEQAQVAAHEYLVVIAFSRDGLVNQLQTADGFPPDVATAAVDALDVDWNEQAVRTAEFYMESETFTRDALVQQLTSDYDRYTIVQAEYAADAVGF
jgi:hypothetical protein